MSPTSRLANCASLCLVLLMISLMLSPIAQPFCLCRNITASFPGLPTIQFLIAYQYVKMEGESQRAFSTWMMSISTWGGPPDQYSNLFLQCWTKCWSPRCSWSEKVAAHCWVRRMCAQNMLFGSSVITHRTWSQPDPQATLNRTAENTVLNWLRNVIKCTLNSGANRPRKVVSCFWSYKSLKNDQPPGLFFCFFVNQSWKKTAKCIRGGMRSGDKTAKCSRLCIQGTKGLDGGANECRLCKHWLHAEYWLHLIT